MKKGDGDIRKVGGGSQGTSEYKKKKRLGGQGLSVEAFVGANRIKPIVTATQIRKQREGYQNSKTVNKYRKTLKHLAEEGHDFRPHIPLSIDVEIPGQDISDPRPKSKKEKPSPSSDPPSAETQTSSGKREHGMKSEKGRQAKPQSQLERLREDYEKKKQEEEEIRKEKRALFEEQQAAREKSKKERKDVQKKFRKTTGKGQPVMKHRMEHLLESIQRDMKS